MLNIDLDKFRAICAREAAAISESMADSFDAALHRHSVGVTEEAFDGSVVTNSVDSSFLDHIANLKHLSGASN